MLKKLSKIVIVLALVLHTFSPITMYASGNELQTEGVYDEMYEQELDDFDEDGHPEIHAAAYVPNAEGEGVLSDIEDEAEWSMVEEVVSSFIEEMEEDDDEPIS